MAFGDLDNDGRIDAVVSVLNGKAQYFHNISQNDNHWILLKLVGVKSNRMGLGAQVRVSTAAGVQYNQTLKAAGGTLPYNWTASGLPGWAQVTDQTAANGLLSGMPSAGTSNVIVTVTDSSSPKLSYSTPPLPLVIVAYRVARSTSLTTSR